MTVKNKLLIALIAVVLGSSSSVIGNQMSPETWRSYKTCTAEVYNSHWDEAIPACDSASIATDLTTEQRVEVFAAWGKALQKVRRYKEAIDAFQKILDIDSEGLSPTYVKTTLTNIRSQAKHSQGICLLRTGHYDEALQVFNEAGKMPDWSTCVNADWQRTYVHNLYSGVALEFLGRHRDAVIRYVFAYRSVSDSNLAAHLVDLYEAAGDLVNLKVFAQNLPSGGLLEMIVMHQMEHRARWTELAQFLVPDLSTGKPPIQWQAREAARLLARNNEQTVPILADFLGKGISTNSFVYHALTLSIVNPQAIDIIKRDLKNKRLSQIPHFDILCDLASTKEGNRVLNELADDNLPAEIKREIPYAKAYAIRQEDEIPIFPEIPAKLVLPSLSELNAALELVSGTGSK